MESGVISDQLLNVINGRQVLAALFTTYTFEPDFFELEIIPLLLKRNTPYSTDERVKRFMVRDKLRESGMPIDIYYDLPMYRQSGETSPQMEYHSTGVNLGNRAFHGKVNMILVKDKGGERVLLIGAGSNNLTQAGWWDNIECQHWEEIRKEHAQDEFVKTLRRDTKFLADYHDQRIATNSATHMIDSFLSSCDGSSSANDFYYYGLSHIEKRESFQSFLIQDNSPLKQYNNWMVEIISPFFVDKEKSNIHKDFLKGIGVNGIKLLLPFDSDNKALCQKGYFQHINDSDDISWADWEKKMVTELGGQQNAEPFRRLHAKVYHFYNGIQSWVFVGSINFTHMAMYKNVEAGFLVKQSRITPMLEVIEKNEDLSFANLDEDVPGNNHETEDERSIPEIHLSFDWLEKKLLGYSKEVTDEVTIQILDAEGDPVTTPWALTSETSEYEGDTGCVENVLKNGSLVMLHSSGHLFPDHRVLLQQLHWSHKPQFESLNLSAEQILAIYAGMSLERRQMMLVDVKVRALMLSKMAGELTAHSDDQLIDQFFCEYAEIFNAFQKLKEKLSQELEEKRFEQLDYYLTGSGVDSLPSLIKGVLDVDDEQTTSSVTAYLLLLSTIEIYQDERFKNRLNVAAQLKTFEKDRRELKTKNMLHLEEGTDKNKFFAWFETQFFRSYKVIEQVEKV